jgi:TRAP transporter TAXI family solute receptor
MNLRRTAALALAGALSFCTASAVTTTAMSAGRLTLGTNPQGSIYYTIGGGIAAALQDKLARQVTVQPFTGSSVYLPLISAGEVNMGLNSSLDLGGARRGENGKPLENLRVLARIWPLKVAFVTRANEGLTKVSDLKGKRVVTDFSAMAAMSKFNKMMLELGGVSVDDVSPVATAGLGPGMAQLTEDSLDATSVAVGIPLTQQAQASIPGGIRYLSIEGKDATSEKADELYPGMYLVTVKPSKRLPEVTEPVTVGGFDVFLTVSADMSDEDASAIVEAFYDALPQLKKDYPPLGAASQDKLSAPSNTVPYHPAAVAFYKSKGLWSDENTARDAALNKN